MRPLDLPPPVSITVRAFQPEIEITPTFTAPSAPQNVEGAGSGSEITVTWDAPLDEGAGPILNYLVVIDELGVAFRAGPETRSATLPATSTALPILTIP